MPKDRAALAAIEQEIAAIRANIIELTEQAAAYSGASDDDFNAKRLEQQAAELERLSKLRDALED